MDVLYVPHYIHCLSHPSLINLLVLKPHTTGSLTGSNLLQSASFLMLPPSETGYSSSGISDVSSESSFGFSVNSVGIPLRQKEETRGRPSTNPHNRGIYSRSLSPGGPQTISRNIHRSISADVSRISPFGVVGASPHLNDGSSSDQTMEQDLVFIQASESASHLHSVHNTHSAIPWLTKDSISGRGRHRHRSHASQSRSPSPYSRPRTPSMNLMGELASPYFYGSEYIHDWQEGISVAENSRSMRWNQVPSHTTPEHISLRESVIRSCELFLLRALPCLIFFSASWALDTLVEHMDMNPPNAPARAGDDTNTFSNHLPPAAAPSQDFWPIGVPTGIEASQDMSADHTHASSNYLPPPTMPGQHPHPTETPTIVKASKSMEGTVDNTHFSNHSLFPTPSSQQFWPFGTHTGIEARRSMAEALDNTLPSFSCISSSYTFGIPIGVEGGGSMVGMSGTGLFKYPPPSAASTHRFQPSGTPTASTQHLKPVGTPALTEASKRRRCNTVGGPVFECIVEGCGGTFTTRHNLKSKQTFTALRLVHLFSDHENAHMGYRPFVCPKCDKDFTTKSTMTRHRDNVHNHK